MHCNSCGIRIELVLQMTPGVVHAWASPRSNAVDVEYDPETVNSEKIRKAIEQAGYVVTEPKLRKP